MHVFKIKEKVIYEILDTEAIVINFDTGVYYTLPGIAKQLWQMIEKNASLELMISVFTKYYDSDATILGKEINDFLAILGQQGLIENYVGEACTQDLESILLADEKYQWDYSAPQFHRYSDIEDLLLLDPIHDVDSSGWPNQSTESTTPEIVN